MKFFYFVVVGNLNLILLIETSVTVLFIHIGKLRNVDALRAFPN